MENYELVKDIGSGKFGVARLMRDKQTKKLVAMKYIERGNKIGQNVAREIINHRSLCHPNIIRFKEVVLTPTHLAIVMEYAAGGELYERICAAGRFSEDEARYFFQQLISGVCYCHYMRFEAGKYLAGWKPCSTPEDLRFWLFKVISATFESQINRWNSRIYCT